MPWRDAFRHGCRRVQTAALYLHFPGRIALHGCRASLRPLPCERCKKASLPHRICTRTAVHTVIVKVGRIRIRRQIEHPLRILRVEILPAKPVDQTPDPRPAAEFLHHGAHFQGEIAAARAVAVLPVGYQHRLRRLTRRKQLLFRKGAQHVQRHRPRLFPVPAHLVHTLFCRLVGRSEQHQKRLCILAEIPFHLAVFPARERLVLLKNPREQRIRLLHREVELVAVVDQIRFVHIRAHRDRIFQIQERVYLPLWSDKLPHDPVVLKPHAPSLLMAGEKAVIRHHHREPHLLRKL